MSCLNEKPIQLVIGWGVPFSYVAGLTAPETGTYAGYYFKANINQGNSIIKEFNNIPVQPQTDNTGLAYFNSETTSWPTGVEMICDFVLYDATNTLVARSNLITLKIEKGNTPP